MSDIKMPDGTMILEPRSIFDSAIVRYDNDQGVLIYDFDLLVEALVDDSGCKYDEAVDQIYYNIIGTKMAGWPIVEDFEKNL